MKRKNKQIIGKFNFIFGIGVYVLYFSTIIFLLIILLSPFFPSEDQTSINNNLRLLEYPENSFICEDIAWKYSVDFDKIEDKKLFYKLAYHKCMGEKPIIYVCSNNNDSTCDINCKDDDCSDEINRVTTNNTIIQFKRGGDNLIKLKNPIMLKTGMNIFGDCDSNCSIDKETYETICGNETKGLILESGDNVALKGENVSGVIISNMCMKKTSQEERGQPMNHGTLIDGRTHMYKVGNGEWQPAELIK